MMNKEQIMITCWITQVETFIYILYDIKISVRMVFEGYWSRFILICYYNIIVNVFLFASLWPNQGQNP